MHHPNQNIMSAARAPRSNESEEDVAKQIRELATLFVLALLVVSCAPCMSEDVAAKLGISVLTLRNATLMAAVAVAGLTMFGGKVNIKGDKDGNAKAKQH